MNRYRNLTIVGTSHISIESVKQVESILTTKKPSIIALELDYLRFNALVYDKKRKLSLTDINKIGFKGFLFNLIGAWVEKKLGKLVGVKPGSEMKKAVEIAYQQKIPIALIDQDISITLKKLSKEITWKEKLRFILDILRSPFSKEKIKFDLTKVPNEEIILKLKQKLKTSFPTVYKILVDERNTIMAKCLYTLMHNNKSVIAIVGAGHEKDIISIIKKIKGEPKLQLNLLKPK